MKNKKILNLIERIKMNLQIKNHLKLIDKYWQITSQIEFEEVITWKKLWDWFYHFKNNIFRTDIFENVYILFI